MAVTDDNSSVGISIADMSSLELVDPTFFVSSTLQKYEPEKMMNSLVSQLKSASVYINYRSSSSSSSSGNDIIPDLVKAALASMQCQCSLISIYKLSSLNLVAGNESLDSATAYTVTCSDITANPDDNFLTVVYSTEKSMIDKMENTGNLIVI